jgi:hypothetical protein
MKDLYRILLALGLSVLTSSATIKTPPTLVPGYTLKLEVEHYLSDNNGVLSASQVSTSELGARVKLYRPDGFCYVGKITQVEEAAEYYKIYGVIDNIPNAGFGFVIAKGGIFAGAVVEKNDSKVYTVEFSEAHKGYVLLRSMKYEKL